MRTTIGAALISEEWLIVFFSLASTSHAGGKFQQSRFAELAVVDGSGDAAVAQHDGAVADLHDLFRIRRDQQDRAARIGEFGPYALDLGAGADIDAARRIDQQQDRGRQPPASAPPAPSADCRRSACRRQRRYRPP